MTTRVYLIRHGATVLTAEDRFAGSTDVELSENGRMQALCLASRLADDHLSAIYASPLKRTMATADILAKPHNLTPIPCNALREIDHGRWEGLRRVDVEAQYGDEYAAWEEDPSTFAPENGESGISVLAPRCPSSARLCCSIWKRTSPWCLTKRPSGCSSAAFSASTCAATATGWTNRRPALTCSTLRTPSALD